MQALKDAGILLVVILLALSVRFTPLEETGKELDLASLTPQTEAAPPPSIEFEPAAAAAAPAGPAKAVFVASPEEFSIREWVLENGDELVAAAGIETRAIRHCAEMVVHIKQAAELLRDEKIEREAHEVVKVLPCSA